MRDPLTMDGMALAVERLVHALRNNEKVAIYADFDLDGTSGLALLEKAFKSFGFQNLIVYQPLRLSEGYGLHIHAIDDLAERGAKVIVTVDVGITAIEAALRAKEKGIDLIITDHHLPQEKLPEAFAIVNPNKGFCESNLGHLSGVGVAFYLALALKREIQKNKLSREDIDLKKLLDVFVIGTITDMVPLVEENRVLVKHGLLQLEKTERPGLRLLMERLEMVGRTLTSSDVALGLAPKLNALSRMENGLIPREVFLVESEAEALAMVDKVLESNETRKNLQREAYTVAAEMARANNQLPFVFVYHREFHKGVVGLLATQLAKDFSRPAFVGYLDEEGIIHGSARVQDGSGVHLVEVFEKNSKFLIRAGGHQGAAGFVLKQELAEAFTEGLVKAIEAQNEYVRVTEYDVTAQLSEVNSDFMNWYDKLEPFGRDFPRANYLFENVIVLERSVLRGGHLKFYLQQENAKMSALFFNPHRGAKEIEAGQVIDVLAEPQWNHFRGEKRIQLQIRDLR